MNLGGIRRAGGFDPGRRGVGARAAVAALAVLIAVLVTAMIPAPAFAAQAPEAPPRGALTAANEGDVGVRQDGARATVTVDADRVYAYVYAGDADPVDVGWQEPAEGAFDVDLSLMPAGEVIVAVLDESGDLRGWGAAELSSADSHAPSADTGSDRGAFPWPLLLGSLAVGVVILGAVAVLLRRRRVRSEAPNAEIAVHPEA